MNCCIHINLHILYIIYCKTNLNIQKFIKIQQVHQDIQVKQFLFFIYKLFPISNSLKFKATQEMGLN